MSFFKKIFKREKKETTTIQDDLLVWIPNATGNTAVGTSSARPAQVHRSDHLQSIKKLGGKSLVPDTSELNEKLKRQREQVENKLPSRTKSMQPKTGIKRNIPYPKPAPRLSLQTSKRPQPTPAPRKTSRQPVVAPQDQPACFENLVIGGVKSPIDDGNIHEESNNHEEKNTLFL